MNETYQHLLNKMKNPTAEKTICFAVNGAHPACMCPLLSRGVRKSKNIYLKKCTANYLNNDNHLDIAMIECCVCFLAISYSKITL